MTWRLSDAGLLINRQSCGRAPASALNEIRQVVFSRLRKIAVARFLSEVLDRAILPCAAGSAADGLSGMIAPYQLPDRGVLLSEKSSSASRCRIASIPDRCGMRSRAISPARACCASRRYPRQCLPSRRSRRDSVVDTRAVSPVPSMPRMPSGAPRRAGASSQSIEIFLARRWSGMCPSTNSPSTRAALSKGC
jgi:hypothetical protein